MNVLRLGARAVAVSVAVLLLFGYPSVCAAAYKIQRVASGLDLPVHVVQAPGDRNSIYVVEELTDDFQDNAASGQVLKVDLATGAKSSFLRVEDVYTPQEGGLHSLAFHPDFAVNGKFYLSWIKNPITSNQPQLRLDEYQMQAGVPVLTKTLLDFANLRFNAFHSLDWIGFHPHATGDERNYLYVTTGDGGIMAANPSFVNESQDLSSLRGKVLRIDVAAADVYPADDTRNYGIPSSNPYANDGEENTLGEIFHSGVRNPWRASFDRETGDFYFGDVGFNTKEEISFAPAGLAGLDFGWARREGTVETPVVGVGGELADSINPIFELQHNSDRGVSPVGSITGGYVYRGPVEQLYGQYLFADARAGEVLSGVFDRTTEPADFDGDNLTEFAIRTSEFNSMIDGEGTIDTVVSFGEDAAGHLYFVDFTGDIFSSPFGQGEVYRLIPDLPADFNDDGFVDAYDLSQWQAVVAGLADADANDDGDNDGADFLSWQASKTDPTPDLRADFDGDGAVDGGDLAQWTTVYARIITADTDGDGDSDGADLLSWQIGLNGPSAISSLGAAVPEPSGIGLLATALAVATCCRR